MKPSNRETIIHLRDKEELSFAEIAKRTGVPIHTIRDIYHKRRRLTIDLDPDVHTRLCSLIPWGSKGAIFRVLVDGLIDMIEGEGDRGSLVLGAILARKLGVEDIFKRGISPILKQERDTHGNA